MHALSTIPTLSQALKPALLDKIQNKTKPYGALGELETLALQIGLIQNSLQPSLSRPVILVFAADHGIVETGVSLYPPEVTAQMVFNFLGGGAAINVFARQHNIQLRIVDSGVNYEFPADLPLIHAKIGFGTQNFLTQPAMTPELCQTALQRGAELVKAEIQAGSNVLGFGEMGIGNTSASAAILAVFSGEPVSRCVGRGTGLDDTALARKHHIISQALTVHALTTNSDPLEVLAAFGGFEIAMMTGAMLAAAAENSVLLIDGFIAGAALLVAWKIQPAILDYCVFTHRSDEVGHQLLLELLGVKPLLNLGLRLGEGSGAALAYPLVNSAVAFLNEMASFESAQVSRKQD